MTEFHKIWIAQCEAARDIKDAFGLDKAVGYLIGEKFLNFLDVSDRHPEFAAELPGLRRWDPGDFRTGRDQSVPRASPPGWSARPHPKR